MSANDDPGEERCNGDSSPPILPGLWRELTQMVEREHSANLNQRAYSQMGSADLQVGCPVGLQTHRRRLAAWTPSEFNLHSLMTPPEALKQSLPA
jgi:hypothetical protein